MFLLDKNAKECRRINEKERRKVTFDLLAVFSNNDLLSMYFSCPKVTATRKLRPLRLSFSESMEYYYF